MENKILIVEDNSDDEMLLLRQLKKANLDQHIKVIRDGRKALGYLTEAGANGDHLAAVFLDLRLPIINGVQLLEAIRADDRLHLLPVVVMTSSNDPEEVEKCRKLGVSCYVQKPLTFSSFVKAFADVFRAQLDAPRSAWEGVRE
jgi:two-component system, response regulator